MEKTTVYLPSALKEALKRAAAERGVSEAEVIRESLRAAVDEPRPAPRPALFASDEVLADRVDEALAGFGEQ